MKNNTLFIFFVILIIPCFSEAGPGGDFPGMGIGIQSITLLNMSTFSSGPAGGITINFRYPVQKTPLVLGLETGINSYFTFSDARQHPVFISSPLTLYINVLVNTNPIILGLGLNAGGIFSYLYEETTGDSSWAVDLLFKGALKFGFDFGMQNIFFSPTFFLIPENIKENGKLQMGILFNLSYQFSI